MTPEQHRNRKQNNEGTLFRETVRELEPYMGLGITFTVSILAFLFLGRWLDSLLNTSPWLLITGAALGLALGFVHMITTLNSMSQTNSHDREEEGGPSE